MQNTIQQNLSISMPDWKVIIPYDISSGKVQVVMSDLSLRQQLDEYITSIRCSLLNELHVYLDNQFVKDVMHQEGN